MLINTLKFLSIIVFLVAFIWGYISSPYNSIRDIFNNIFSAICWVTAFLIIIDICISLLTKKNFNSMLSFCKSIFESLLNSLLTIIFIIYLFNVSGSNYLNNSINIALFGLPLVTLTLIRTIKLFKIKEASTIILSIFLLLHLIMLLRLESVLPKLMLGEMEFSYSIWVQITILSQSIWLFIVSSMLVYRVETGIIPSSILLVNLFKSYSDKTGSYEELSNQAEKLNSKKKSSINTKSNS